MASIVDPASDSKSEPPSRVGRGEDCPVCGMKDVPVSDTGNFAHHLIPGTLERGEDGLSCRNSGDVAPSFELRCPRCQIDLPAHIPGDGDCLLHLANVEARESAARIDELRGWVTTLRIAATMPAFGRNRRKAYGEVADMLENAASLRETGGAA